jgi:thiamine monophosphate synthase
LAIIPRGGLQRHIRAQTAKTKWQYGRNKKRLPQAWYCTDPIRDPNPLATCAVLPAAVGIIVRHYDFSPSARVSLVRKLRAVQPRRIILLAGDWRLAHSAGADGVHLPEYRLMAGNENSALRLWAKNHDKLIGCATHRAAALARARALAADYVTFSPIFITKSHPGAACWGHLRAVAAIHAGEHVPDVYALGGVNANTIKRLPVHAFAGYAAIGGWQPYC